MALSKARKKKAMELLKSIGVQTPEVEALEHKGPEKQYSALQDMLNAEFVLVSLQRPIRHGIPKICKDCNQPFVANYPSVAYCGDLCRASALRKVGFTWWINKATEEAKWGGIPPSLIPPEVLSIMKSIIVQVEQATGRPVQTTLSADIPVEPSVSESKEDIEYPLHSEEDSQDNTHEVQQELSVDPSMAEFLDFLDAQHE